MASNLSPRYMSPVTSAVQANWSASIEGHEFNSNLSNEARPTELLQAVYCSLFIHFWEGHSTKLPF